jgi:uncharacterized protein (DUF1684 family)
MTNTLLALVLAALVLQPASYRADVEAFRKDRAAEIGGEEGWAALTGLHWLGAGDQTIGRAATNAIVLTAPSAPDRLGVLHVTDKAVTLRLATAAKVKRQPAAAGTEVTLVPNSPTSDGVSVGGMTLVIIQRGARRGVRVWDRDSPDRLAFKGLQWYPIGERWKVDATFTPHQPAPKMSILNVLNDTVQMTNPGTATFTIGGTRLSLEALLESDDADELFFMFRDQTSGKTTYGATRYLYSPLPKDGHVTLDFNKATNPPCAFTRYATCPLPPASNRLSIAIEAGETYSESANHRGF